MLVKVGASISSILLTSRVFGRAFVAILEQRLSRPADLIATATISYVHGAKLLIFRSDGCEQCWSRKSLFSDP
jgi:hypothetical protein